MPLAMWRDIGAKYSQNSWHISAVIAYSDLGGSEMTVKIQGWPGGTESWAERIDWKKLKAASRPWYSRMARRMAWKVIRWTA